MLFGIEYKHILIAAVLYLILVASMCTSVRVVPYSRDNLFSIDFPYEGFEPKEPTTSAGYKPVSTGCQAKDKECIKVHGFSDLYCSPRHTPHYNEKFLGTPGGAPGNSYGLSNSKGSLQLTSEQVQLLNTRGGNSAGVPTEISK